MDFRIPTQLEPVLARIREFVERELIPLEPAFLNGDFRDLVPVLAQKRAQVKAMGLWAPFLPQEYGGMGLALAEYAHVSEQLGRCPLGHYAFNCQAPDVGNMEVLMQYGTAQQKADFLGPLTRGEVRSCFAMTEPENPGSNPVLMDATAQRVGDELVIDGHKWFTTGADGAAFTILMAITAPEADRHKRAGMILVPMDTPGLRRVRNISIMGDPGSDHNSHGELLFEQCRVPAANLLGPSDEGFRIAQERLGPGRIHHCMRWIGICERAFDLMCERALRRRMSSNDYLADQQTVQNWIAESRAEINAARLLVLHAAWKIDNEPEGASAARVEVSTIKFYVANVLQQVLDRAIQTHGALGLTDDTPLAHWYRHERAARIYDGPDEVHKWVVARQVLREYRERGPKVPALTMIDRAEAVRAGEELPVAALESYLRASLPEFAALTGENPLGALSVRQFPRGYSNLTYLLTIGDQEWVLRRPPFGANIASAHDMGREHRVLAGLRRVYAKVPRPLVYCDDAAVIGAPFYVMERLRGVVLRAGSMREPHGRDSARLSDGTHLPPDLMRRLSLSMIDNLAAIHALDFHAAGLHDLGKPEGYVERQIRGWARRYRAAQTDEFTDVERVLSWLESKVPDFASATGATLIHNDYKYDNLVLDPDDLARILAVLDWEMCTLGDPLMDLGTTLGYWIEPGDPLPLVSMFGLTTLPGNLDRRQLLDRYVETSGRAVTDSLFYYVYGVFKIAVIIQQIYARYRQGHTSDERFAALGDVVQACGRMGALALDKGRIHHLNR